MTRMEKSLLAASRWEAFLVKKGTTVQKDGNSFELPTNAMIIDIQGYNAMMEAVEFFADSFKGGIEKQLEKSKRERN